MRIVPQIHRFPAEITAEELTGLPRQSFKSDWFGIPLEFRARFVLAATPRFLHFLASTDLPAKIVDHELGRYVEGLWEQDVAELFIREAGSTHYQEWNVSPSGAWWSHALTDVRVRKPDFVPDFTTGVESYACAEGWQASLKIPYNQSFTAEIRINVTMILTSRQGQRRFLSCCPESGQAPNFHNIQSYPQPRVGRPTDGTFR